MNLYIYNEGNRDFIVIAENLSEAYNELYRKGLLAKVGQVKEINSTVVMVSSLGVTLISELRNVR